MLVDTHLHLTDDRLIGEAAELVSRARAAGIGWMVTVASDLADSERTVDLASRVPGVYASVGIHPHAAAGADAASYPRLAELARRPRVVAIGETGLDHHYDNSPREAQHDAFRRHLRLAADLDLPAIVHARSADAEVREVIEEVAWGRGVLHCFSSGRALLDAALALGWYISFGGMITFPKWADAESLRAVPLDRLLLETDSPYLAPVPHRGRRNEPAFVTYVAARAAELRGEAPDALRRATTRNAETLFGVTADGGGP